ncbi:uncharacterized protein LOC135200886 isoform X2 [Macrobrachium nipponense]|uniref:uncharacterized protein LOC135200886 isoform X2 n=1 Tax=Macrobrachium nipponense TaxID=159736 RepID=UPI0030C7C087
MGSVYFTWAFLQYLAILATAGDGSAKFPGGNGLNKAPSVTSHSFKVYNGSSKDEPIFPSSKTTYGNTSGDNISASEDDFLSFKLKRSSGDAPCHSKVEGNDTQTVGSFEGASASLYFKASEHFQRMEVNLRLRGYLRLSRVQILNERFSIEDLGVADDLDRWHMLHVGVYAEGSEFLGSEWKIFVFNDADSAVSSKAACLRRPTDEVVGLDIAASGPSEWRCDKPAGFTNPSPRTSRSRASGRHHPSVVAFAVGLLALLGLLTSVVFLLRFLLKKKKMMKRRREDRAVLHQRDIETEQRRTNEGISNDAARPVSSHSSENSLYGVVIATDTNE